MNQIEKEILKILYINQNIKIDRGYLETNLLLDKKNIEDTCKNMERKKLISKINYKEYKFLRKFLTEQGKIIPGFVTGVSSKYQRLITKEIKKARNIALLPYVNDPRNI